jgi:hypothetical protein
MQRQPGVDDVLDNDDVPAVKRRVEVLEEPHLARRGRACGITGERHEIERHLARNVAHEIGQEDEGAFQHRDQVQVVGGIAAQLRGELGDALLNLRGRE